MNVLILGGDARYLEVIDALCALDKNVYVLGYDQYLFEHHNITKLSHKTINFSMMDAIILPVHGTTPDGKVTSAYSKDDFQLTKAMIEETPKHCTIYTGTTNKFLSDATKNRNTEVLFARDDIAIYNAIPTAEATLQLAMEHTNVTVHGANVIVLGFGRVGFTVARLFHQVGANVTVSVRKSADVARIIELGMKPIMIDELASHINDYTICINTIPHLILDERNLASVDPKTLIIDLASAPGGTDFQFCERKGIKALHALGLPGKTAPKTAGKIIAQTIISLMKST